MFQSTIILLTLSALMALPKKVESQNERTPLSSYDVFVLRVNVKEKIGKVYSQCVDDKKKCHIYNIAIDSIFFYRDTLTYKSANDLKKCQFVVMSKKMARKISLNKNVLIGVYSNGNSQYLILNEVFKDDSILYVPWLSPHVNSEWTCKEYTFLQKFLYRLHIAQTKIISNGKSISLNEDNITKVIQMYQSTQAPSLND